MALTPGEQARFDELLAAHASQLVEHVRQNLRTAPKAAIGVTAVAQSAWASLMDDKRKDAVLAAAPDGIWEVLRKAAQRHCEKHNKRSQRHPTPSLEGLAGRGTADERRGFDPAVREEPPESRVMADACREFYAGLRAREQRVLAMMHEGLTPEEMADQLGTDPATAEEALQRLGSKLEAFRKHLDRLLDQLEGQGREE